MNTIVDPNNPNEEFEIVRIVLPECGGIDHVCNYIVCPRSEVAAFHAIPNISDRQNAVRQYVGEEAYDIAMRCCSMYNLLEMANAASREVTWLVARGPISTANKLATGIARHLKEILKIKLDAEEATDVYKKSIVSESDKPKDDRFPKGFWEGVLVPHRENTLRMELLDWFTKDSYRIVDSILEETRKTKQKEARARASDAAREAKEATERAQDELKRAHDAREAAEAAEALSRERTRREAVDRDRAERSARAETSKGSVLCGVNHTATARRGPAPAPQEPAEVARRTSEKAASRDRYWKQQAERRAEELAQLAIEAERERCLNVGSAIAHGD